METDLANGEDIIDQGNGNEVELRELVYQSLERDGLISRLKAQLRAAVFKTIEKAANPSGDSSPPGYEGQLGRICRTLVHDWIEHSRLLYTEDIFNVETSAPNHPPAMSVDELINELHLETKPNRSQPILHALINRPTQSSSQVIALPEYIKQSIETKFPSEKINDINRVREHFRSLFSSIFDSTVLDAFLMKMIPATSNSIAKYDYEQICLKWIQSCSKALTPPTIAPMMTPRIPVNNSHVITKARRAAPGNSDSDSSSSSSSSPRATGVNVSSLPTISSLQKATNVLPPPLLNFNSNGVNDDEDEEEEETSSSIFSKRNATPAQLKRLENIENIARDDQTPRTRTTLDKLMNNGNKDGPAEYDDESFSQSQISSVDDVTVDKAAPSPSNHIDYLEDF